MKKQITYTQFVPRVFAATIDLFILSIILTPVMNFAAHYVFRYVFNDFIVANNINITDRLSALYATSGPDFANHLTFSNISAYMLTLLCINGMLMSFYFIGFWQCCGSTPGKMLLRMKIVDAQNYAKPSFMVLVKRYLFYCTAIIGILMIVITKRGQAMHDKIAGTVVVKT